MTRLQQFINEKTFDVFTDVEYIYNKAFKSAIEKMQKGKDVFPFPRIAIPSGDLPSPDAQTASKLNPITIYCLISRDGSFYNPKDKIIQLSISFSAIVMYGAYNFDIMKASENLGGGGNVAAFLNEFTGDKIKGTIAHELSHWMDDTMHNFHITDMIEVAMEQQLRKNSNLAHRLMLQGKESVGVTFYEMEAQIHDIKQMKKENEKIWDKLTFDNMLLINGSLSNLSGHLNPKEKVEWRKYIMKRMAREGLLGRNMR